MGRKSKTAGSGRLSLAISIILIAAGLAMILYPTIANLINQSANGRAIKEYRRNVESTDDGKYEGMLSAVRDYNAELAEDAPYIADLTVEMRKRYESLLNIGGNGIIGYIEIPKANVYLAVYHGTAENVLEAGAGHLEGSSLPVRGESVHTVLTGHSGLPSARLFTDIDQLEAGDTFTLHVMRETLIYEVEEIRRTLPEELEGMRIEKGRELCTLVTCTPYGINTHRLAVTGRRIETKDTTADERPAIVGFTASKWNRMFVLLPPLVFISIILTATGVRKMRRKRGKAWDAGKEDDTEMTDMGEMADAGPKAIQGAVRKTRKE